MIQGKVNAYREATIRLTVSGPATYAELELEIDTGFNGFMMLPESLVERLELPWRDRGRARYANASVDVLDIHEADVEWDGQIRQVPVHAGGYGPLIGMSLLYGHYLTIRVLDGGEVQIAPVPSS